METGIEPSMGGVDAIWLRGTNRGARGTVVRAPGLAAAGGGMTGAGGGPGWPGGGAGGPGGMPPRGMSPCEAEAGTLRDADGGGSGIECGWLDWLWLDWLWDGRIVDSCGATGPGGVMGALGAAGAGGWRP